MRRFAQLLPLHRAIERSTAVGQNSVYAAVGNALRREPLAECTLLSRHDLGDGLAVPVFLPVGEPIPRRGCAWKVLRMIKPVACHAKLKQPGGDPIDKAVGRRLRLRRLLLGLSQSKVAEQLDISFQQLQKYELGENRLGASYLYQLAFILNVPVDYFFGDLPQPPNTAPGGFGVGNAAALPDDALSREGVELMKAFSRITDARTRRSIADLVEQMAHQPPDEGADN
jgi:transcriptional regulator with XRE-family HTH domain